MSDRLKISGDVLHWARTSMGFSIEEAAKKAQISEDYIVAWETGIKSPTYKQLEKLAETVYKRSLAVLLMHQVPEEAPIQQDFRNLSNAEQNLLSPDMRIILRKAKRYQAILEDIAIDWNERHIKDFKLNVKEPAKSSAVRLRDYLGLTIKVQKAWRPDLAFDELKTLIETVGIYVFQLKMPFEEARAFCLTGKFPLIVLNTEDSKNGRIFSLMHEVCHILLNINDIFRDKETGKQSKSYSGIETYCNEFAAQFLVPDKYFDLDTSGENFDRNVENLIKNLSSQYNVSNEVIARKMLSKNFISESRFWALKRGWDGIAKAAKEERNRKLKEKEVSGIAQDAKIISEKGKPYIRQLVSAYHSGEISTADLLNFLETKSTHLQKIINRLQK